MLTLISDVWHPPSRSKSKHISILESNCVCVYTKNSHLRIFLIEICPFCSYFVESWKLLVLAITPCWSSTPECCVCFLRQTRLLFFTPGQGESSKSKSPFAPWTTLAPVHSWIRRQTVNTWRGRERERETQRVRDTQNERERDQYQKSWSFRKKWSSQVQ